MTHLLSPKGIPKPGWWGRIRRVASEEWGSVSIRFGLAQCLVRLLPPGMWGRLRAALYRTAGLRVGQGTLFAGPLTLGTARGCAQRIQIGSHCFLNTHIFVDAAALVTLGNGVSVGHHVVIVTSDHAIGPPMFRAGTLQPRPVTLEDGVWIGAGVTLLPGVTVGAGSVVAAGAVVTRDVPANTLVGGIPAKVIRQLDSS
jgi:maltose O-acetyltransferase